jgi:hypothetical protein
MGPQRASAIETFLVGLQVRHKLIDLLRITNTIQPGQTNSGKDRMPFAVVEIAFEPLDQLGMFGEGTLEGLRQVPPIDLIGGTPAMMTGQGFDPFCTVPHQQQMLSMGEAEMSFAFEEQSFPKVCSRFHAAIAYTLLQAVAAVPGSEAFKLFAGREQTQAHFEAITVFPLGAEKSAIYFRQDQFPLGRVASWDFAMLKDGFLKIVFFLNDLRPCLLHPAVQTAVIDGFGYEVAEQKGCLAIGQTRGQSNRPLDNPGTCMLAWSKPQQLVQWTTVSTFSLACLPARKTDPTEAGQHMQLPALISKVSSFLLFYQLIFQNLTGLKQKLLPGLLKSRSDFLFQFFQVHSVLIYT